MHTVQFRLTAPKNGFRHGVEKRARNCVLLHEWLYRWVVVKMSSCTDEWLYRWVVGEMSGWRDQWLDGWKNVLWNSVKIWVARKATKMLTQGITGRTFLDRIFPAFVAMLDAAAQANAVCSEVPCCTGLCHGWKKTTRPGRNVLLCTCIAAKVPSNRNTLH